jgi:hypothetical protein
MVVERIGLRSPIAYQKSLERHIKAARDADGILAILKAEEHDGYNFGFNADNTATAFIRLAVTFIGSARGSNLYAQGVRQLLGTIHRVAPSMNAPNVVNIIWGLAMLEWKIDDANLIWGSVDDAMLEALSEAVVSAVVRVLPNMNASDFAKIIWGLHTSRLRVDTPAMISVTVASVAQRMNAHDFAEIIWWLARLVWRGDNTVPYVMFQALSEAVVRVVSSMNAQDVVKIIWGLATLQWQGNKAIHYALYEAVVRVAPSMNAHDVANIIRGLATLQWQGDAAMYYALGDAVVRVVPSMNAHEVVNIIWGLVMLKWQGEAAIHDALGDAVVRIAPSMNAALGEAVVRVAPSMNAHDVAKIIETLANIKWPVSRGVRSALDNATMRVAPLINEQVVANKIILGMETLGWRAVGKPRIPLCEQKFILTPLDWFTNQIQLPSDEDSEPDNMDSEIGNQTNYHQWFIDKFRV